MCSCGKPRVWPVSWRMTRLYSDSGVFMVNPCRFMVWRFLGICRMSVPRYDQYPPGPREIRTSPVPCVATNEIAAVLPHAFMWVRMRVLRFDGVLSIKLTVKRRGLAPQYLDVNSVIASGVNCRSAAIPETAPNSGAFTG